MEPLKNMFNKKFYECLAIEFNAVDKNFHPEKFVKEVMVSLDALSLNQRMRQTTVTLQKYLPSDYTRASEILLQVAPQFKSHYTSFLFPDYVGQYGHEDFKLSMDNLKELTSYSSSEFAIREFLKRDFQKTMKVMYKWAEDKNYHVRRLASEGCRPRLPWSFNLDEVIKNPEATKPILIMLNADKELCVKKSVANHLNDFSRLHTDWMLKLIKTWDKKNEHTAWIIKHASRTLIKNGNLESLAIFGFERSLKLKVSKFKVKKANICLGENLEFSFDIISKKNKSQKLVIDYAIYYQKKSGGLSPKVFKLKEIVLKSNATIHITKKHSFKNFSTRQHYSGKHIIEIMVNGELFLKKEFLFLEK